MTDVTELWSRQARERGHQVTQTPRRRSLWQPRPGRARRGVHGEMLAIAARTARAKVPEPPP
jgi:hypothetical protein